MWYVHMTLVFTTLPICIMYCLCPLFFLFGIDNLDRMAHDTSMLWPCIYNYMLLTGAISKALSLRRLVFDVCASVFCLCLCMD